MEFGQIIKDKICVHGRILSSTNGSKLIFHMMMYLFETGGNIREKDLMIDISRSANFRLWPISHG